MIDNKDRQRIKCNTLFIQTTTKQQQEEIIHLY